MDGNAKEPKWALSSRPVSQLGALLFLIEFVTSRSCLHCCCSFCFYCLCVAFPPDFNFNSCKQMQLASTKIIEMSPISYAFTLWYCFVWIFFLNFLKFLLTTLLFPVPCLCVSRWVERNFALPKVFSFDPGSSVKLLYRKIAKNFLSKYGVIAPNPGPPPYLYLWYQIIWLLYLP